MAKDHNRFSRFMRAFFNRRWQRLNNRRLNRKEIDDKIAALQKLKEDQEGLGRAGFMIGF